MRCTKFVGLALLLALFLTGCSLAPDAIIIPISSSADPVDIELLHTVILADARIVTCDYTWTNDSPSEDQAWFEVSFPSGQRRSEFEAVLEDIEGNPAFSRVVASRNQQWWHEP